MLLSLLEFGPAAFFYLIALAATVGGWTNQFVAVCLAIVGTLWLAGSFVYRWHTSRIRAGKHGLEPIHIIVLGLLVAILGLLITAGGVGWQRLQQTVSVASPVPAIWTAAPAPPSHYGIAWNFDDKSRNDVYFLSITKQPGQETTVLNFQASGINVSDSPISCNSATVVSDLTGDRLPVDFYIDNERVPVDQARAIPPTAEFRVYTEPFSVLLPGAPQQLPVSKFLAEIGEFSFIFDCNTGGYKRRFSVQEVRDLVNRLEVNSLPKPRMSKKPSAQ
jgi:hypothetical protein